jgi:hypothetical protein
MPTIQVGYFSLGMWLLYFYCLSQQNYFSQTEMQIKSEVILRFKKEVAMRCMTSKILLKLDKLLKVYV